MRLIEQAKEGDVQAFNRLIIHYQGMAYNVAYRIMGTPQGAEDSTQDAFISAYKALHRFRGGNFKAWLMRIVTNSCYDELRKRKRRPQTSFEDIETDNESLSFLRSSEDSPETHQQKVELVQGIESCLQGLPDDQRIVTVLCDVEGYSYDEISEIAGVSLGTVKSRISRARRKLRDCLRGLGELLPFNYRQEE